MGPGPAGRTAARQPRGQSGFRWRPVTCAECSALWRYDHVRSTEYRLRSAPSSPPYSTPEVPDPMRPDRKSRRLGSMWEITSLARFNRNSGIHPHTKPRLLVMCLLWWPEPSKYGYCCTPVLLGLPPPKPDHLHLAQLPTPHRCQISRAEMFITKPVLCSIPLLLSSPQSTCAQSTESSDQRLPPNLISPGQRRLALSCLSTSSDSVQEQTGLGILHHPSQPLFEVLTRHRAAPKDVPPMCPDCVELECLTKPQHLPRKKGGSIACSMLLTCDSSSPVMHPLTSVLLAKTRRLAPDSRYGVMCQ